MSAPFDRDSFPTPVAERYAAARSGRPGAGPFGAALDAFEAALDLLTAAALSLLGREGALSGVRGPLGVLFRKGAWGSGDVLGLLREATRTLASGEGGGLSHEGLVRFLWAANGKATRGQREAARLVGLRNVHWGHGSARDDGALGDAFPGLIASVDEVMGALRWLEACEVWAPMEIDGGGLIGRATRYRGTHPTYGADVRGLGVTVAREDLDRNEGAVLAERTPVLVHLERGVVVPLAPFVTATGDGLRFLAGVETEGGRVVGATYRGYGASATRHRPGRQSFEVARLNRLAEAAGLSEPAAGGTGGGAEPARAAVETAHGLGLAGVWAEQADHLRGFVGRADVRRELASWAAERGTPGYLAVLGPPGQGKSALMARLAADLGCAAPGSPEALLGRGEGPRPGVVLHHVKQSADAVETLRSLVAQAKALAGTAGEEGLSTAGALRDRLVEALGSIDGGAVLLVDALDEWAGLDLSFLPPVLPPGVRGVVSCRPGVPVLDALRGQVARLDERPLGPLSRGDFDALLEAETDATAAAAVRGAVDLGGVFERTAGVALLVREAVRVLREAHRRGDLDGVEGRVPTTLDAVFRRQVRDAAGGGGAARAVLGVLAVARSPLRARDLHGVLAETPTPVAWGAVTDALEALSEVTVEGPGGQGLYHAGLSAYVREHVVGPDALEVHRAICAWSRVGGEGAAYGRRHRIRHLAERVRLAPGDGEPERVALRAELTSWGALADAAEHGALWAWGQAALDGESALGGEAGSAVAAWGEFARSEAGRCEGRDDAVQQARVLAPGHPVRAAAEGSPTGRPTLIPTVQPEAPALPGRVALGAGGPVTRLAPFAGGFAAFRDDEVWTFGWDGRSARARPDVLGDLLDVTEVAVPSGDGRYWVRERADLQLAKDLDDGPGPDGFVSSGKRGGFVASSKSVAVLRGPYVAVGSNDRIRVYSIGDPNVVTSIDVVDLLGAMRDEVGLGPQEAIFGGVLAPEIVGLSGGEHLVCWSSRREGDRTSAHYGVWRWATGEVVWQFAYEWVDVTDMAGGTLRADARPLVLGGRPRFTFRQGLEDGVLVYDADDGRLWPVDLTEPVGSASPDGRFLYDDAGQVWDVESGECVRTMGRASVLGFSADGRRVLWERDEPMEDGEGAQKEGRYVLRVSGLDGHLEPAEAPTRSGARLSSGPVALGEGAVVVAYEDGSVRVVPLEGARGVRQALFGETIWVLAGAAGGVLESVQVDPETYHVRQGWTVLESGETGTNRVHEARTLALGAIEFDPEAGTMSLGERPGPVGEELARGGHAVVDGAPEVLVVYALRAEPGVGVVQREDLRAGTSEEVGRFWYGDDDPDLADRVSTRSGPPTTARSGRAREVEVVRLDGLGSAVVWRSDAVGAVHIIGPGGPARTVRFDALRRVEPTPGGDVLVVSAGEKTVVVDARTGEVAHETEGLVASAGEDVAFLLRGDDFGLGQRIAVWDWSTGRTVAVRAVPDEHSYVGRVVERSADEATVVLGSLYGEEARIGLWRWREDTAERAVHVPYGRHDVADLGVADASGDVVLFTAGDQLVVADLDSRGVAAVWLDGLRAAAVCGRDVLATDRRGLWRFAIEGGGP